MRALAGLVVGAALMAVAVGPAHAAAPGGAGKIAFMTYPGGGEPGFELGVQWDLIVMDGDGSSRRNVTRSPWNDKYPSWSPDGGKIVYSQEDELFTMNPNGSGKRSLGRAGLFPSWSPDGTKIAYAALGGIAIMNADGTGARLVTNAPTQGGDVTPRFSPDGRRLLFTRGCGRGSSVNELRELDLQTNRERSLVGCGSNAAFGDYSPDGRYIVAQATHGCAPSGLAVFNRDGSGYRALSRRSVPNRSPDYCGNDGFTVNFPSWSPNGERVLFTGAGTRPGYPRGEDGNPAEEVASVDPTRPELHDFRRLTSAPLAVDLGNRYPMRQPLPHRLPQVTVVTARDLVIKEGSVAQFTIALSRPAPIGVRIAYDTKSGTAKKGKDVVAESGTVTIKPGSKRAKVSVQTRNDAKPEGTELFHLLLRRVTGGGRISPLLADGFGGARIRPSDGGKDAPAQGPNGGKDPGKGEDPGGGEQPGGDNPGGGEQPGDEKPPPEPCSDDLAEDDDSFATAYQVDAPSLDRALCPGDADLFTFTMTPNQGAVAVKATPNAGLDVKLELFNVAAEPALNDADFGTAGSAESLEVSPPKDGEQTYWIRATTVSGSGAYQLTFSAP